MAAISKRQRSLAEHLVRNVSGDERRLASALLVGPRGAGKRTVIRTCAELLGKKFVELPVMGHPNDVTRLLFGDGSEAQRARTDNVPPGEIGRGSSSLIYLSGLERTDPSILGRLHALIARRTYTDELGNAWRVSDDTVLAAALTFPAHPSGLDAGHWIVTAFDCRVPIDISRDPSELLEISQCIVSGIVSDFVLNLDLGVEGILQAALQTKDNLHALRRWLERACIEAAVTGHLGQREFRTALLADLDWLFDQVPYRGHVIERARMDRWMNQFPEALQGLALRLVQRIASDYYISQAQFHEALARLIEQARIRQGQEVIFCRWQVTGDSAAHLAHVMKAQAGWRDYVEVDLHQDEEQWPRIDRNAPFRFVVVDDFAGSGGTLLKLLDGSGSPVSRLLDAFPNSRLWILVVAGFDHGLREIRAAARRFRGRLQLIVDRVFYDKDRCFTSGSEIVSDPRQRQELEEFCRLAAKHHMPRLPDDMVLGFKDSGALVVFYEWVPNNTLPILWYDRGTWHPLFPRSGLIATTQR